MADFVAKFFYSNAEINSNKNSRFTRYLRATSDGTLLQRPGHNLNYQAHLQYHAPIFGRLQTSYDDVEFELNRMRNSHLDKKILFVGGDGLSIIRILGLMKRNPALYVDSAPLIVPMQGEAPHGVYHVLHAGWRQFRPFIRILAQLTLGVAVADHAVPDEPLVTHFNKSIYALQWMARACSEYMLHIIGTSNGMIQIDRPDNILQFAARNIDLNWVVHFLYDYAYLVLEFKHSVSGNNSEKLDLLWREFFAIGKTGTANKTMYVQMAIMRIWWAEAMHPDLAHLYHNLRGLPMSRNNTCVGWDTPIEWLNYAITVGVRCHVSEERIAEFVKNYSFTDAATRALLEQTGSTRNKSQSFIKSIDSTVNRAVAILRERVGDSWETATAVNLDESRLGIDGRLLRGRTPWEEVEHEMTKTGHDSIPAYIASHVRELTSSFYFGFTN